MEGIREGCSIEVMRLTNVKKTCPIGHLAFHEAVFSPMARPTKLVFESII